MPLDGEMVEITWLGRGGQGAVMASEILAQAAIMEGRNALSIPEFGAERRGAPVRAYNRIAATLDTVVPRTPITQPHILVVMDPSLLRARGLMPRVRPGGTVLVNTGKSPSEARAILGRDDLEVHTINATEIAMRVLGRPIVNTILVGALVRAVPLVSLESVKASIREKFSGRILEKNLRAVEEGYNRVVLGKREEVIASV